MDIIILFAALIVLCFAVFGVLSAITSVDKIPKNFENGTVWIAPFSVVFLWAITPLYVDFAQLFFGKQENDGQFGDQFGAVTSLFSGLAFVGLVWTLVLQRTELSLQREELKGTRREFELQRFEATLFSLIDLLNAHVEKISFQIDKSNFLNGRAALEYFASELEDELLMADFADEDGEETFEVLPTGKDLSDQILAYEVNYAILFESDLGPYFRLLYHCIRHIEYSSISDEEKQRYSKIVRAYLGPAELKLLFFNCMSKQGKDFKPWVEKYYILKHLGREARNLNPSLEAKYSSSAFSHE